MEGSQAEPQIPPPPRRVSDATLAEGKQPPPSSGRQICSQPPGADNSLLGSFFCAGENRAGGEKAVAEALGRLLLQRKDGKRLHELPPRRSIPCSRDNGWSREKQARLVFPLLPSSLLQGLRLRGSLSGPLSWLIPPRLSLQPGPGASDLRPSSPKTSSSTKPSPRQRRKRNPPRMPCSIWSALCTLCPPGDAQRSRI